VESNTKSNAAELQSEIHFRTPECVSLAPILSNYLNESFRIRDGRRPEFGKSFRISKFFAIT
jgi:hypothetical protein